MLRRECKQKCWHVSAPSSNTHFLPFCSALALDGEFIAERIQLGRNLNFDCDFPRVVLAGQKGGSRLEPLWSRCIGASVAMLLAQEVGLVLHFYQDLLPFAAGVM